MDRHDFVRRLRESCEALGKEITNLKKEEKRLEERTEEAFLKRWKKTNSYQTCNLICGCSDNICFATCGLEVSLVDDETIKTWVNKETDLKNEVIKLKASIEDLKKRDYISFLQKELGISHLVQER